MTAKVSGGYSITFGTVCWTSPRIQRCLQEEELCRTTLTCRVALDVIYMSMEWQRREQCFLRKHKLGYTVDSSEFVARRSDLCGERSGFGSVAPLRTQPYFRASLLQFFFVVRSET